MRLTPKISDSPAATKKRVDALANASDVDHGTVLSVVNVSALPPGITYDAATHSFSIDPADPVRFDFALCHIGMNGACGYGTKGGDAHCPLKGQCRPQPLTR